MDLLLEENPFGRRRYHRRSRRNPTNPVAALGTLKDWTQGVGLQDAAFAVGGLAAASIIPGIFIKVTDTTTQKLTKIGVALLATVAAGALGNAMIGRKAGQSVVLGGLAGTAAQAIGAFTTYSIGNSRTLALGSGRRIGESTLVSPPLNREGEMVGIISP